MILAIVCEYLSGDCVDCVKSYIVKSLRISEKFSQSAVVHFIKSKRLVALGWVVRGMPVYSYGVVIAQ